LLHTGRVLTYNRINDVYGYFCHGVDCACATYGNVRFVICVNDYAYVRRRSASWFVCLLPWLQQKLWMIVKLWEGIGLGTVN